MSLEKIFFKIYKGEADANSTSTYKTLYKVYELRIFYYQIIRLLFFFECKLEKFFYIKRLKLKDLYTSFSNM